VICYGKGRFATACYGVTTVIFDLCSSLKPLIFLLLLLLLLHNYNNNNKEPPVRFLIDISIDINIFYVNPLGGDFFSLFSVATVVTVENQHVIGNSLKSVL
jgi:hypothetical protein